MTKIIAISNHKGGVGKTTSCVSLAYGFNLKGYKVLMIDLDPQTNLTLSVGLGKKQFEYTSYHLLRGEGPVQTVRLKDGLDIIPASLDLAGVEIEISKAISRETILRGQLNSIKDRYDYIFIDCPPSLGLITINAFTAADYVLIPLQAEFLALHGLSEILKILNDVKDKLNPSLELGGIFLTRYDQRKILNKNIAKSVEISFTDKIFNTMIRENVALAEAPSIGKDIFSYNPASTGAKDYKKLVDELLGKF